MRLNADFALPVVIRPGDAPWVASPLAGVERRMLDRIGEELARATSIVRYAPGSHFSAHGHPGGEEFLVLDGVFSDERGDYPAGTYVRNPIGSRHAPFSREGCTIFVKLMQFDPADRAEVVIDSRRAEWTPGLLPGQRELALHVFADERVRLLRWAPGTAQAPQDYPGGAELLVLEGSLQDERGTVSGRQLAALPGAVQPPPRAAPRAACSGARPGTSRPRRWPSGACTGGHGGRSSAARRAARAAVTRRGWGAGPG